MYNFVECCGHTIPAPIYAFLEENSFSVRAAAVACRLHCSSVDELVFQLYRVADGEIIIRNCGNRTKAEIAEKISRYV